MANPERSYDAAGIAAHNILVEWKRPTLPEANNAAFKIGCMVAGSLMNQERAKDYILRKFDFLKMDDIHWSTVHQSFMNGRDSVYTAKQAHDEFFKPAANDNQPKKQYPKATPFVWIDPADIPRRECLYGNHLYRKFVSATFGAGGGGKSNLVIADALAMISRRPLLGHTAARPLKVWYVNLEDPVHEITRRVTAAALHHKVDQETLNERLYIDSGRDQEFVVLKNDGRGTKIMEPVVAAITRELVDNDIDVLIVDPFISTHEVEENDNTKIQLAAALWVKIADEADCAIELVHHVTKSSGGQRGSEVTAESGRGAGALKDKARSIRVINGMSESEATKCGVHTDNRFDYFRVGNAKSNMSRRSGHDDWRKMVSVDLGNGGKGNLAFMRSDNVGVVEQWEFDSSAGVPVVSDDQMNAIKAEIAKGTYRSDAQAKDWAGHMIARELDLDSKNDGARIKQLLKEWVGTVFQVEKRPSPANRNLVDYLVLAT